MEINIVDASNYKEIEIAGELDASSSLELDSTLQDVLSKENKSILVNFSQLQYISSPGIGVFTSRVEDCVKENIHIIFYGMSEKVFSVFKILGLDQILPIVSTKEQAKERLNELQG